MVKPINAFLLALLLVTGSAWAEWVRVVATDMANHYIDPATIRKDGNLRKVWEINDLKQRGQGGELSRRMRMEYDCKQERLRFLLISAHSEAMAFGTNLRQEGEDLTWTDIPPGTILERILKIVCAQ